MHLAAMIFSAILALAYLGSGGTKLAGAERSLKIRDQLRVAARLWSMIGALEVLGSVGLLVGLVVPAVGVAAAITLGLLMVGAIAAHCRVNDVGHAGPAALLLVVAVVVPVLRIASM